MDTLAKRTVSLQAETHPVLASSRGRNRSKNKNDNMFGLTPNSRLLSGHPLRVRISYLLGFSYFL
jgi:hypothetical protein